jgi:hypothetical protein
MKKLLIVFTIVAALLTGCADTSIEYKMSEVKLLKKSSEQSYCRGTCYSYSVTVEKDGNKYTFTTNSESYKLVSEGDTYDLIKYEASFGQPTYVVLNPTGISLPSEK